MDPCGGPTDGCFCSSLGLQSRRHDRGPTEATLKLILVSGPPGVGKSTIAEPLARTLGFPLIQKDVIKEVLFETLGTGDREWSQRLSRASFMVMFGVADGLPQAMLEGNFDDEDRDRTLALDPEPIEIHCSCSDEELVRRFRARTRHPGHLDDDVGDEELIERARRGPLRWGGPLLELDTEEPDALPEALTWAAEQLQRATRF
jgi:predicted kinase